MTDFNANQRQHSTLKKKVGIKLYYVLLTTDK